MRGSLNLRASAIAKWAFLASLFTYAGCGSGSNGEFVSGTVTYKGHPLPNATVTFFPQQGRPMIAPLDANGSYSVDLSPGTYQVTVMVGAEVPPGYEEGDPLPLPPPSVRLPAHYTIRARTQLSAEVVEGQSEPIDFDLQ